MTEEQEELYRWFDEELSCNFNQLVTRMNRFFESNVCIPKGANRHPDADVLHTLVEDTSLRYEVQENTDIGFYNDDNFNQNLYEYRIKPSEPVYEWQWYVVSDDRKEPRLIGWNTEEEREKDTFWSSGVYRMEETKRVRKGL